MVRIFNVRTKIYPDGSQQIKVYNYFNLGKDDSTEEEKELKRFCREQKKEFTPWGDEIKYESFEEAEECQARSAVNSLKRTKATIYDIARSNDWELFVTMTFNPELVDSFDYSVVSKKLSDWLKNVKRRGAPDMVYLFVPERHKSGRWHFHGLMSNCVDALRLVDSGHRDKDKIIYNISRFKYGFTTATFVQDVRKCSNYILKYITKDLVECSKNKKRFWASKNVQRPELTDELIVIEELEIVKENLLANATYVKTVSDIVNGEFRSMTVFEMPADW